MLCNSNWWIVSQWEDMWTKTASHGANYWPESSKENNCDDLTTKTGLRTLLTPEWWWWTGSGNNCGQNKVLSDCLMNSRPCLTVKPFPHTHRGLNSCVALRKPSVTLIEKNLQCLQCLRLRGLVPKQVGQLRFSNIEILTAWKHWTAGFSINWCFPPMAVFEVDNTSVHWAQIA